MNVAEMTGLDYLLAMGNGELPMAPMAELMGIEPVEAAEGRVVFAALTLRFRRHTRDRFPRSRVTSP